MPIDEYLNGINKAEKWITTMRLDMDAAFIEGTKELRDAEGMIDPEKCKKDHRKAADKTIDTLAELARKYTKSDASAASDEFSKVFLLNNFGMTAQDVQGQPPGIYSKWAYMASKPLGVSSGNWTQLTEEQMQPIYSKLNSVPVNFLKPHDAGDVIKKADPEGRRNLDPTSDVWKEPENLAILLNPWIQSGCPTGGDYNVFTPQYLHRYMRLFEEGKRKGSAIVPAPSSSIVVPRNRLIDPATGQPFA